MNRFFICKDQIIGDRIEIIGKDVKHIRDVLRLKNKDRIEILSENRTYICEILEINSDVVLVSILDSFEGKNEPPIDIILYQGIAKGDKMDFIIQKCTEIGVKEIYPIVTNRTIVKIKDKRKEQKKVERWKTIAEEAAKQSKRDTIPIVNNIITYNEMIHILDGEENIIVPYEMERMNTLKKAFKDIKNGNIHIIIGPEGGFEEKEINAILNIGGKPVSLGPRILRTETAGIVVISITLYELGDLGVRL
ncbi:16S rRNA (uracil(1498)-N(3))-methyltransferase [Clostridium sp. Cult1]|uniref:16S rRNA (uracil(1498)-N(3))-methyltransferase n=1 Tax=Clostridium sp. Cult1 TaxID=2079002 RepID=UPI001F028D0D|nr:16S rRNA (uracil(1498)-N(3))-methyltransferase [Clostridium sp. Cult1]MCF6461801.1 16S rRNA (uracil(1498)-N(3))-methyltransferase [Clostridium sp. Cult1]